MLSGKGSAGGLWAEHIIGPVTVSVHKGRGYMLARELVPLHSLGRGTSCSAFCIPPCTKPTLALVFALCLWEKTVFVESDHRVGLPRQALPLLTDAGVCYDGFEGPELHTGSTAWRILCSMVPRLHFLWCRDLQPVSRVPAILAACTGSRAQSVPAAHAACTAPLHPPCACPRPTTGARTPSLDLHCP